MLIRCYFVTTVMVDTISSASNRSSLKFPSAIGIVHHVLLQHLDSYLDHATLFRLRSGGGYMRISSQPPLCIVIYVCACIFLISFYL
jgi:hypothetical protein